MLLPTSCQSKKKNLYKMMSSLCVHYFPRINMCFLLCNHQEKNEITICIGHFTKQVNSHKEHPPPLYYTMCTAVGLEVQSRIPHPCPHCTEEEEGAHSPALLYLVIPPKVQPNAVRKQGICY